jgi:NAD-dependent dihydropyrimidine dehydrogenase PreA subunit
MANNLNFFRGEYSKFLELVNSQQVDSTNLYFTVPDTTPKEEVKDDKKSSSFCVFHGTNLLASATHEADLNKVIGDVSSLTERINNISSELATYTMSAVTVDDKNVKELQAFDCSKCVECGMCSFVCPSHIELTDALRKAKMYLRINAK